MVQLRAVVPQTAAFGAVAGNAQLGQGVVCPHGNEGAGERVRVPAFERGGDGALRPEFQGHAATGLKDDSVRIGPARATGEVDNMLGAFVKPKVMLGDTAKTMPLITAAPT